MRLMSEMNVIQIEATNLCNRICSNCTRFCGHYTSDKIFFTSLEYIEKSLISLQDFPSIVGLIGGEPTLHPDFVSIVKLYRKYRPRHLCGLWTNTTTQQYKDNINLIDDVFGIQNLNDHTANITHTPLLVSSDSLSNNNEEKTSYFQQCWVQMTWSATITPKGAYFCEVAGMICYLFDGIDGWNIENEPDWWKKPITDYTKQIEYACNKCGGAFPCIPRKSIENIDDVSMDNLIRLQKINSPKYNMNLCKLYDGTLQFNQNRSCDWYWNR